MSTATSLRELARQLDDADSLGRALDEMLASRTEPPTLLALGEPTHGIKEFPLLRNEILIHLVERGHRSIALEIDLFAASIVDNYIAGSGGGSISDSHTDTTTAADIETVLATGFSHGFGNIPGNRELVEWLRTYNTDRPPQDRIHFHGFDAPVEFHAAPSPRQALTAAINYLPAALRPTSAPQAPAQASELDTLLGDDADWSNPAAMHDPTTSIGNTSRARALRIIADDLASALHRAAPTLHPADPTAYTQAAAHARTAQGLLRYHAAMASPAPDRIATLLSLRTEMMAENLLAIAAQEQQRGPTLVFAHNAHLQPAQSHMPIGPTDVSWSSAGALVAHTLGTRYAFIATDANPHPAPNTLQAALAEATTRRALFPTQALRTALPPTTTAGDPIAPGHIPLTPADLPGTDAVIFIADTDGIRHQYW
ncbi:MAG TPA: erythromycin esterase family protein [Actinocrinis sp.]|nr:erythromycin esterase family protein [Actinocrinis sp.]